MTDTTLIDTCIYTIRDGKDLERLHRQGLGASFPEQKRWTTATALLARADRTGRGLAVVFADARKTSRLRWWGLLTKVTVAAGGTTYNVDRIRRISGHHEKSELRLAQGGMRLSRNFIRPYAICRTPSFLSESQRHTNATGPSYWVVKGRPSENEFKAWLKAGRPGVWRTASPPKDWRRGDRLFFWAASPQTAVIGLGELTSAPVRGRI